MKKKNVLIAMAVAAALSVSADEDQQRIDALEQQLSKMNEELASIKQTQIESGAGDLAMIQSADSKLTLGGYGEIHATFEEGGKDTFDIHRLVMYVGYEFADWIKLSSEVELEHAFVNKNSGGEISIEQLYADFLFGDAFNLRAGRMLAPMGIINQKHEPTLFYGVERPNVDKYIIPSTWSVDGAGIFGSPLTWLSYELYAVAGLDGEGFDGSDGIRGGRIKERSSFNDAALTGRLDFYPLVECDTKQDLRFGLSGYYGGTDNANKGGSNGVENEFGMLSADFQYDVSRFKFRGVVALGSNSDADALNTAYTNNVGDEVFGWYLESAVSVMPASWKKGKLEQADLLPFIRYEEYNTQHKMGSVGTANGNNDRQEVTIGVNVPLTRQFVVKADYQFKDNKGIKKARNQLNFGMGWVF